MEHISNNLLILLIFFIGGLFTAIYYSLLWGNTKEKPSADESKTYFTTSSIINGLSVLIIMFFILVNDSCSNYRGKILEQRKELVDCCSGIKTVKDEFGNVINSKAYDTLSVSWCCKSLMQFDSLHLEKIYNKDK